MVRRILRDSGFNSIVAVLGVGVAVCLGGLGLLAGDSEGNLRTAGWVLIGGGILIFLLAAGPLIGIIRDAQRVPEAGEIATRRKLRLRFPFMMPFTFEDEAVDEPLGPRPLEPWLAKVVESDREDLKRSLHSTDSSLQEGHVLIHWDKSEEYHQPYVAVSLGYVSASVYTMQAILLRGELLANHQRLTGNFDVQPFEIRRNVPFWLTLRFLITSDASMAYLREQASKGVIYFSFDLVRIGLTAKEDSTVHQSELAFSPQYWRPAPLSL